MLRRAAKVYTIKMFQLFEIEFVGCMGVRLKEAFKRDEVHSYEAIEDGKQSVHKIQYNSISFDISCSCKCFESLGILCRHALKVFDINNITVLPTQYILKRWTREAKKGIVVSNNISGGTKIVKELLVEAMKRLEKDKETQDMLENLNKVGNQSNLDIPVNSGHVLDPPCAKTKGMTNERIKDIREKKQRKNKQTKDASQDNQENMIDSSFIPRAPLHVPAFNPHFGVPHTPFHNQGNLSWTFGNPNFCFNYGVMPSSNQDSCNSASTNRRVL
ncbi:protein FAR1-RELATED SEQUENCE 1-like isoform X5 [Rosa chinensis]|uniref:protein FAR1-RELATED SEQUENCE 1-like isoform X5 n=1 Tax=Rosa chinensis TaxID=74649 RepID=UPI001AD8DE3F|nr:protein FAR1-RELATED SEQUENCE 1-like isoform X5 [Rosa chinensis]